MSVYIIAEAGVNHNGDLDTAIQLINAAKKAGANCIKFQTFKSESLVCKIAKKAAYQQKPNEDDSQLSMLKELELSYDAFVVLEKHCKAIGIDFLSTPFDEESIAFLNGIEMPFWKIPSGEVTNYPYLVNIAKTNKPVVMSTGMCTLSEISNAINVLKSNGAKTIRLLHCNTDYPTPFEDVNLLAMETMKKEFGLEVGYSDHTKGIEVPVAAVALGATIIEKHFTLSRCMSGPDHKASLEPKEFFEMVSSIRNIEKALGDSKKIVTKSELKNITIVRKSIVAKCFIKKGDVFTEDNLTTKRPGIGISPMKWPEIVGQRATKDYQKDDFIEI